MNDVIALSGVELLALGREASQRYGYMDYEIINKLEEVTRNALTDYSSIFAIRVDLRFTEPEGGCPDSPVCFQNAEGQVMKRFIASLKSQLKAYDERRIRAGIRFHPTKLRYVWVCEQNEAELPHYHLLIVLNKAAYWRLNSFQSSESLAGKIQKAWCSALSLDYPEYGKLVHFPENCEYILSRKDVINRTPSFMQGGSTLC
ncbi:inovirus Gp2 family protein [Aeromonas veronii]|uniref:inovirus Gp2 family protein n=1 Tax=Aeromonas veronii TaxID=654 RepID=UPI003D23314F